MGMKPIAPDDIILFESGEWTFWGDLNDADKIHCESRDYTIIRYESEKWQELLMERPR